MDKWLHFRHWGWLAVATGFLLVGITYGYGLLPVGVYAWVIPTVCAALAWGRRGGLASALLGGVMMTLFRRSAGYGPDRLVAFTLAVGVAWVVGTLSQMLPRQGPQPSMQELETLQRLGRLVSESLDLDTTLRAVLESLRELVSYDVGEITLFDATRNVLVRRALLGKGDAYRVADGEEASISYSLDEGLSGWLARNRRPLSISDLHKDSPARPKQGSMPAWLRSYLGVPLLVRGELVGTLEIAAEEPGQFTERDVELAEIFGGQAAVAIENARVYMRTGVELQRRVVALESLQRVTREITSTVDLDYILQVVLREAMAFSEAEAGVIALVDEGGGVELRVHEGYDAGAMARLEELARMPSSSSALTAFLEEPEMLYLPDVTKEPGLYPGGARSILLAPVFYEGELAAAIMLQSEQVDAFPPAVREFVEGLSVQTAIAVGNARLYQEQVQWGELMHQRAEQMSLLLEVSRTMRSDRPLEDILLDVAYAVQEGTGFDIVLISVLEGDYLRRVAGAGIPLAELERMRKTRQPWSRVKALFREEFRLGQCYYVPAEKFHLLSELDVFIPDGEEVRREPGRWHKMDAFLVPLRGSRGDIVGFMSVDKPRDGRVPTARTAEIVEIFAAQIALAIENNRLVEDLVRQVNTLQLFNELNRSITTKLDLSVVLNTVTQAVTNVLGYDYATIFLKESSGGQGFIPMASSGYALELLSEEALAAGNALVNRVARTGMPLVLRDVSTSAEFAVWPVEVGSSVLVPLTVEGHAVGVLQADRREAGEFSPTEVATLTALADQVSVAVENARLFDEVTRFSRELEQRVEERTQELAEALERLRRQRDQMEVLYRIASELVASLDFDRVLSQALVLLKQAVHASRGSVILVDRETGNLVYRAAIGHTEPIPPGGKPAPFSRDRGVIGEVLTNRRAVVIHDVREEPRWEGDVCDEWVRAAMVVPILDNTGEAVGVICLLSPAVGAFDESEVRLVEAAAVQLANALNNSELYRLIREQAERLGKMLRAQQIEAAKNQAILEGIADGVIVADANGRVILFNAAAERILSVRRAQALGRFIDDLLGLYGEEARAWLSRIEQWRESPESYGLDEFFDQRLEFGRRIVSMHISPVVAPSHEFLGVVSVLRDITAEVEADRAKSEFVSMVSHELRTPMTAIKGYVDLLLMGSSGPLNDLQRSFLTTVKSNADRLTSLVNDLLDISRIEMGRMELHRKPLHIEKLIEQVVEMLRPKAEEKDLRLYTVLPEGLPRVFGDEARLTQVLTNLVGNAYKYTPAGGEVGVYAYVRNGMMHVAVADTGIGIGPEDQERIFERFYRVDDPAVMEVSGTGLGLSITVSLIQMHGGDIWLESELGEGSIFTFTVPLAEGEPVADVGEPPEGFARPARTRILVVAQDSELPDMLKALEEAEGLQVLRAASGREALGLARREVLGLIIVDAHPVDMKHVDLLSLLKQDAEAMGVPVALVFEDGVETRPLGVVEYLTKPLDEAKLLDVVHRVRNGGVASVLVVDKELDVLREICAALEERGVRVWTTARSGRALRLARELHPALILLGGTLPDEEREVLLDRLRRNSHTATIPIAVMDADVEEGEDVVEVHRLVTRPLRAGVVADEIVRLISQHG